jgi:hypothetical protein
MEREVQGLPAPSQLEKNGGDETNDWLPVRIWIAAWVPPPPNHMRAMCVSWMLLVPAREGEQVQPRGREAVMALVDCCCCLDSIVGGEKDEMLEGCKVLLLLFYIIILLFTL